MWWIELGSSWAALSGRRRFGARAQRLVGRAAGQSTVEYALVGALVVIAAAGALTILGGEVTGVFTHITNTLGEPRRATEARPLAAENGQSSSRSSGAGRVRPGAAAGHLLTLGVLQVVLYAHARDVLLSAVQEGARLAAEDGRGIDEGYARAAALVSAGLGASVEPVRLQASLDDESIVLRADTRLRPILPLPLVGDLPIHTEGRITRERFRPGRRPMTTRVFDCQTRPIAALPAAKPSVSGAPPAIHERVQSDAARGTVAGAVGGGGRAPQGWPVAAATALTMLTLVPILGRRAHWGWLTLLIGLAAIVAPRGQWAVIGPAAFVATGLCLVFGWPIVARTTRRASRVRNLGSREREAQLLMGVSGERHVGQVLAHELPQEYVLINGLKLPRGAGDIDHLVVGPSGVFLLETKTMAGQIVCDPDGSWRRTQFGPRRDCLRRVHWRSGRASPAQYLRGPRVFGAPAARPVSAQCRRIEGWSSFLIRGLAGGRTQPRTRDASRPGRASTSVCTCRSGIAATTKSTTSSTPCWWKAGTCRPRPKLQRCRARRRWWSWLSHYRLCWCCCSGHSPLSRLVQAQTALVAVAHEAARAAALGVTRTTPIAACATGLSVVAPGAGPRPTCVVARMGCLDLHPRPRTRGGHRALPGRSGGSATGRLGAGAHVRAEHSDGSNPFRSGIRATRRRGARDGPCVEAQALVWFTAGTTPVLVDRRLSRLTAACLFASRRQLQSVADGAARAGATRLDLDRLRASGGADVQLDPGTRPRAPRWAIWTSAWPRVASGRPTGAHVDVGSRRVHVAIRGHAAHRLSAHRPHRQRAGRGQRVCGRAVWHPRRGWRVNPTSLVDHHREFGWT